MLYLGNPSTPEIRAAMSEGMLGCMITPTQGNVVPDGTQIAGDNGCFGSHYRGDEKWFDWLGSRVDRYGADRFLFAVAPDVPFDAAGTLAKSLPWLDGIRELGIPAAFAAQDGCDLLGVPWDAFDVLFLAGSTDWKIGPIAERLSREARDRGKHVHMGRVNSLRRLRIAEWFGCRTVDGTYLVFAPAKNLGRLAGWIDHVHATPSLFGG